MTRVLHIISLHITLVKRGFQFVWCVLLLSLSVHYNCLKSHCFGPSYRNFKLLHFCLVIIFVLSMVELASDQLIKMKLLCCGWSTIHLTVKRLYKEEQWAVWVKLQDPSKVLLCVPTVLRVRGGGG